MRSYLNIAVLTCFGAKPTLSFGQSSLDLGLDDGSKDFSLA